MACFLEFTSEGDSRVPKYAAGLAGPKSVVQHYVLWPSEVSRAGFLEKMRLMENPGRKIRLSRRAWPVEQQLREGRVGLARTFGGQPGRSGFWEMTLEGLKAGLGSRGSVPRRGLAQRSNGSALGLGRKSLRGG